MKSTMLIFAALTVVLVGCDSGEEESEAASLSSGAIEAEVPSPEGGTEQRNQGFSTVNNEAVGDSIGSENSRVNDGPDTQVDETGAADSEAVETRVEAEDASVSEDATAPENDAGSAVTEDTNDGSGEADTASDVDDSEDAVGETLADATGDGVDISELTLNGEYVPDGLPVPLFIAENHDGGSRTEVDVIGQPTIMWFFPFAGTPG